MRRRWFAIAILMLGSTIIISGCAKNQSKYVGKYVSDRDQSVLELKSDGSFTHKYKQLIGFEGDYRTGLIPKHKTEVETGKWIVEKWDGRETIYFIPYNHRLKYLVKTSDGNLIQFITGETFVKDSRTGK